MKQVLLWILNSGYEGYLINPKDVYKAIDTHDPFGIVVWKDIPGDTKVQLPEYVTIDSDVVAVEALDRDELLCVLDELVGSEGEYIVGQYYPATDALAFSLEIKEFFNLDSEWDVKAMDYHKNSNLTTVACNPHGDDEEYLLEIIDSYNLDTWDGRNYSYGSMGRHAILHKVKIVDDPLEEEEVLLLWEDWSQWQGEELPTGYFLTHEEALEELADHEELAEIKAWLESEVE